MPQVPQPVGATVIKHLDERYYPIISQWLEIGVPIKVDYPDMTASIVGKDQ